VRYNASISPGWAFINHEHKKTKTGNLKGEAAMKRKGQSKTSVSAIFFLSILVIGSLFVCVSRVPAADAEDAQGIVDNAYATFTNFMSDQNYTWLHENLKDARALIIYPQIIKGGFIIGGSGGTGVLLVKDEKTGEWSQPVFYTIGAMSVGLQIGGEVVEMLVMVMSDKGIDSLYASSFKLGGEASIAAGPVGSGAKQNAMADFISFAKSKGAYVGLNLEGSVVAVRDSLNEAYYGKEVRPVQIVVEKQVSNNGSTQIREGLRNKAK
jgi:lipid-binding SYLF domain-containing protein